MKKYLIISGLAVIVIIAVVIFSISRKNSSNDQIGDKETYNSPISLPSSNQNNRPIDPVTQLKPTGDNKLVENTPSGLVTMNDFSKGAEIEPNGVIYPVFREHYNIGYNSTDHEFIVTLTVNNNIEAVRKNAENDLISSLGISKDDACKLKVYLYVSAGVTENNSLTQNHGLSFCAGSQSFPN
jgi:hypothetical protein